MRLFARDKGAEIEQEVCRYLQKQGLRLITRNYHCRGGEIDLIMREDTVLVFIEVRFRRNAQFGSALESVDYSKQSRLIHTAEHYLQRHTVQYSSCRFDVVAVRPSSQKGIQLEWVKNAFDLG